MYRLQRDKNINMFFYTMVTVGLIFSIFHLTQFIFDMALSIVFYQKANIPSIAYLICHLLIMYIPLLLVIPNLRVPKAIILKWVFLGIALCYLLGNTWIIYYMIDNSALGLFTDSISNLYAYQRNTALMFNYMMWNCYSPLNVVYSLIQMFLFFIMAESLYNQRAVFSLCLILTTLLSVVILALYTIFSPEAISHRDYIQNLSSNFMNNVFLLGSQLVTSTALLSISTSPNMWEKFLWTYAEKR